MQQKPLDSQEQQICARWSSPMWAACRAGGLRGPAFAEQRSKVRGPSDVTALLLAKITGGGRGDPGALQEPRLHGLHLLQASTAP